MNPIYATISMSCLRNNSKGNNYSLQVAIQVIKLYIIENIYSMYPVRVNYIH